MIKELPGLRLKINTYIKNIDKEEEKAKSTKMYYIKWN